MIEEAKKYYIRVIKRTRYLFFRNIVMILILFPVELGIGNLAGKGCRCFSKALGCRIKRGGRIDRLSSSRTVRK